MKKRDVEIGGQYVAKVSGKLTNVRITGDSPYGGWDAVNTETGRAVRIRTAARLRSRVDAVPTEIPPALARMFGPRKEEA